MSWAVLLAVLLCSRGVDAGPAVGGRSMIVETVEAGGLIYDMSQAPAPRDKLAKRQDNVGDVTALPSSRLSSAAAEGTASPTGSGAIATATGTSDEKLPRPFDSSLGNNFTSQACPDFFDSFLSNQTFQDCLPLSLLLQVRPRTLHVPKPARQSL